MRSTLFFIPHEIWGVPLFGFGWLLAGLAVGVVIWLVWSAKIKLPASERWAALPVVLVATAIVTLVLPNIEQVAVDGEPIGLPIRGYGVMVLLGLLAGVGITVVRGKRLGIMPDTIVGLGFWMMLGGIVGARLFYVVQKWSEYDHLGFQQRIVESFKLTEGGLVIYGGIVGGLLAAGIFCWRQQLHIASTADLIAPGFLIGLSLGRIGCLLHGCCFGGVCTAELPAIQFPAGSGPYNSQLDSGRLLGIELEQVHSPPGRIATVEPNSPAAQVPWHAGQYVDEIAWGPSGEPPAQPTQSPPLRADVMVDGQRTTFLTGEMPPWSLPTHPSQIYASINALLLCLLIWHLQPLPRHDGMTFLIAVALYALSRFLLEWVRSDEGGQLGTPFTIAQLIAMASGLVAVIAMLLVRQRSIGRKWQWGA